MPIRPTASTINDNQLDALWAALDELEVLHQHHILNGVREAEFCAQCGHLAPCPTAQIISRQRSVIQESPCTTETRTA